MKKTEILLASLALLLPVFAASCAQDGDKIYLLNKSTVVVAAEEGDMEPVFSIDGFEDKIEANLYVSSIYRAFDE